MIGANIGTTLTPWIISYLGFHLDISAFALPVIGIGALCILVGGESRVTYCGRFLIGFGFLFLGLEYMKDSVETLGKSISLGHYSSLSIWGSVLVGLILTTIIQTSTGTTIITLTALNGGLISLDMAFGIVIGANLGSAVSTTLLGFIASTRMQNTKRQVALGHFLFNITTTLIVIFAYEPIRALIFRILGESPDPTIALALFHTLFNIILACIWTPMLGPLLHYLRRVLPKHQTQLGMAIEHINISIPEEIIAALTKDTQLLIEKTIHYNRAILLLGQTVYSPARSIAHYVEIKQMEEKLLKYIILHAQNEYTPAQAKMLHTLNAAVVQLLTSSKYLKDNAHHIDNIHESQEAIVRESFEFFQQIGGKTTNVLYEWMQQKNIDATHIHEYVSGFIAGLHSDADVFIGGLSTRLSQQSEDDINIAEIMKVNYYLILSCESLLHGYESLVTGQDEYVLDVK